MIKHTFIEKTNTIYKDSKYNLGLNPVAELNYGAKTSRVLLYFNEKQLKDMYENGELGDLSQVKHVLRLTNCMSQDGLPYEKNLSRDEVSLKERAVSFDVILFKLPKNFDAGRGFDYQRDFWVNQNRCTSSFGSTWYNCATNNPWDEEGVYSTDTLEASGNTLIVAKQHFDFGNEEFCFDITEWVNNVLKGEVINHGLGMAFAPDLESSKLKTQEYVGFFTDNTNTFFHPYLETIYSDYIMDDRAQFYIGKTNRLYLYSVVNGEYVNLDTLPTCQIDETPYAVKQAGRGVYYVEIAPSTIDLTPNTIYYDTWSNLALNGEKMDDIELEFVALSKGNYFNIGAGYPMKDNLVPSVSGIDDNEDLHQGEVRRVIVDFRKKYLTDKKDLLESAEYRIYVNDGNKEITVYDYSPVEKTFMSNFFYINVDELIPGKYHVDIRVKTNGETRTYKDKLMFNVVSDITEFYR